MNNSTEWDNEDKTIIHCTFEGRWTWEDFHRLVDTAVAMMNTVDHKVMVIADFQNSTWLPPSNPLTHFQRAARVADSPQWAGTVILGGGAVLKVMINAFRGVNTKMAEKLKVVESLEAARAMMKTVT